MTMTCGTLRAPASLLANGPDVRVWWGAQDGQMTQILGTVSGTDEFTVVNSDSFHIEVKKNAKFDFDDIDLKTKNNLGQFLHLSEDSQCIDAGDPEYLDPFRDFDDQMGPLDGPDSDDPPEADKDMGADEWPKPEDSSFWWENF